ncbi:hypothetical protein FCV25MIE_33814 [Fagus crenata]
MISCPCVKCVNSELFTILIVHDHLVSFGISKGYQTWIFHGESLQATTSAETSVSGVQEISNEYGNIHDILHDVFPMHNMSEPMEEGPSIRQPAQEPNKDAHRYLARLKSHVRNKAHIEGSIAEGYLAEECLTFCSRYLESVETVFNRPIRNSEHSTEGITVDTSPIIEENFTDDESNDVEENFTDDESDDVEENFSDNESSDN